MKHYLSLCAIIKNEAEYLEEWLRFYDLIGVEHFYLYDNESTDGLEKLLLPWHAAGRITLYKTVGKAVQQPAYNYCINNFARDSNWIMFVDADEYLFSPVQPDLRVFLQAYEAEAGVVANWLMFGAGGHQHRPAGLTMLNFTQRCDPNLSTFEPEMMKQPGLDPTDPASYYKVCHHIKSIVNTREVVESGGSPHDFRYRDDRNPVNANRRPATGPVCEDFSALQFLRINHYASRSWEEFGRKLDRGRADVETGYDVKAMIERNRLFGGIEDHEIFPLARRVEADMRVQTPPRKLS